jgi:hypothetical protein
MAASSYFVLQPMKCNAKGSTEHFVEASSKILGHEGVAKRAELGSSAIPERRRHVIVSSYEAKVDDGNASRSNGSLEVQG